MVKRLSYQAEQVKTAIQTYYRLKSFRRASKFTGIPKSTIHRWNQRIGSMLWSGDVRRKHKKRRRCQRRIELCQDAMKEMLEVSPVRTLKSIQIGLERKGFFLSLSTIHRYIRRMGFSFHSISWRRPPRSVLREQQVFWSRFQALIDEGRNIVSIDEAGFLTSDLPARGYGRKGHRLYVVKRHPKRFKVSIITAISRYGDTFSHVVEGNVNGTIFKNFMKDTCSRTPSGSVVLLDNIGFHKSHEVSRLANDAGVEIMFIPPYSPECNPVEISFRFSSHRLDWNPCHVCSRHTRILRNDSSRHTRRGRTADFRKTLSMSRREQIPLRDVKGRAKTYEVHSTDVS
jgi:hypothetical protein